MPGEGLDVVDQQKSVFVGKRASHGRRALTRLHYRQRPGLSLNASITTLASTAVATTMRTSTVGAMSGRITSRCGLGAPVDLTPLRVQVAHVLGVGLDELFAGWDLVAHEHVEDFVGAGGVF